MNLTIKKCTKCGESKPTIEFSKDASKRDGLSCRCKACDAAQHLAYRAANLDKVRAKSAAYCAANRERARARAAAWYAANQEKQAAYRAANTEKRKAVTAAWRAANPEAYRIYDHNRRARKLASGGKLSSGLADKLFKLQRGKCACGCKQPLGDDYHLDHRMPLALGGSNTDDNMQLLTATCNLQKSTKHPVDFAQQRGLLL